MQQPVPFTDLLEVKKVLQIDLDDHALDYALNYYIETATDMIAEFLDRPGFYKKSRTEYYNGTGTQKLLLKSRPVYIDPEPVVYVDAGGIYGQGEDAFSGDALEFGGDYGVWLDTDSGSGTMDLSRCGILIRKNDFWEKPSIRERGFLSPYVGGAFGNIKVTYTGGYTLQNMPSQVRMATIMIVARMKYLMPIGVPISSESYEERHISFSIPERNYLFGQVKHLIYSLRNWSF
jgi:hypothetical protein